MIEIKREIILEEGTPVEVKDATGTILHETTALIGKATKNGFPELSIEYHRLGQFVPEIDLSNGAIISNLVVNRAYLVMATFDEVIEAQKCATIARMVECNGEITISSMEETADEFGNVTKTPVSKVENLSVFVEAVRNRLEQKDPGLHASEEYKIYAPVFDVTVLDTVTLAINGRSTKFKVEGVDFASFRGVVIIELRTETRR